MARTSLEGTLAVRRDPGGLRHPLTGRQELPFPLAEAETQYAAARLLCLQTLWLKDRGLPPHDRGRDVQVVGPQGGLRRGARLPVAHGHSGYSNELPFEQHLRGLLGLQIGDGTAQIMKMVIARRMTKDARSD